MTRWLACLALLAGACTSTGDGFDFSRMRHQRRVNDDEAAALPGSAAWVTPPDCTVPRERTLGSPVLVTGMSGGAFAGVPPIALTRGLLDSGRVAYADACAACHGAGGFGGSMVAENMYGPRPPSLRDAAARAWPAGRVFRVITAGGVRMPSLAWRLPVRERWAVVAWVRALGAMRAAGSPAAVDDSLRAAARAAEHRR